MAIFDQKGRIWNIGQIGGKDTNIPRSKGLEQNGTSRLKRDPASRALAKTRLFALAKWLERNNRKGSIVDPNILTRFFCERS